MIVVLLAVPVLSGCGEDSESTRAGSSSTTATAVLPPLARRPAARGEIVVRGETSPATHGPYTFDGRYLVRFEQYAPEDPKLDFASQTPFTAALVRRQDDPRGGTELFGAATRSARRDRTIRGRYYVDISFGDYPYVIRFTPR